MTCQPVRPVYSLSAAPVAHRRAPMPIFRLLRRLVGRLMGGPRMPRLRRDELSEHRLRDLGLHDGR